MSRVNRPRRSSHLPSNRSRSDLPPNRARCSGRNSTMSQVLGAKTARAERIRRGTTTRGAPSYRVGSRVVPAEHAAKANRHRPASNVDPTPQRPACPSQNHGGCRPLNGTGPNDLLCPGGPAAPGQDQRQACAKRADGLLHYLDQYHHASVVEQSGSKSSGQERLPREGSDCLRSAFPSSTMTAKIQIDPQLHRPLPSSRSSQAALAHSALERAARRQAAASRRAPPDFRADQFERAASRAQHTPSISRRARAVEQNLTKTFFATAARRAVFALTALSAVQEL